MDRLDLQMKIGPIVSKKWVFNLNSRIFCLVFSKDAQKIAQLIVQKDNDYVKQQIRQLEKKYGKGVVDLAKKQCSDIHELEKKILEKNEEWSKQKKKMIAQNLLDDVVQQFKEKKPATADEFQQQNAEMDRQLIQLLDQNITSLRETISKKEKENQKLSPSKTLLSYLPKSSKTKEKEVLNQQTKEHNQQFIEELKKEIESLEQQKNSVLESSPPIQQTKQTDLRPLTNKIDREVQKVLWWIIAWNIGIKDIQLTKEEGPLLEYTFFLEGTYHTPVGKLIDEIYKEKRAEKIKKGLPKDCFFAMGPELKIAINNKEKKITFLDNGIAAKDPNGKKTVFIFDYIQKISDKEIKIKFEGKMESFFSPINLALKVPTTNAPDTIQQWLSNGTEWRL